MREWVACMLATWRRQGSRGPPNLGGHGGAEELGAALARDDFEDLVDLLLEVHVEQPVRLVQHQVPQQLQAEPLQKCNGASSSETRTVALWAERPVLPDKRQRELLVEDSIPLINPTLHWRRCPSAHRALCLAARAPASAASAHN